jgi:beta-glucosidase
VLEPRALVAKLSLDEKARLMTRYETGTPWEAPGIGLKPMKLSDGPAGVRPQSSGDFPWLTPCETALAASWDPDLVRRIGELVGDEARRRDVQVIHAPNVNLPRSPLGGRAFEQFAEDPLLTGILACAWMRGLQSRHVASVVKHLAANDSETERQIMNSVVTERVLREVYLLPFEMAVEAGAWGIMSAYNRVNGVYCGENAYLLKEILKHEWQFDGFVISDAGGTRSTSPSALAGLDLELPGPGRPQRFGEPLAEAVRNNEVSESVIDAAVERLLRLAQRTGRLGDETLECPPPVADPRGLLREAAAAGFVLLQNRNALLPLRQFKHIAVIGPNAAEACYQGGAFSQLPLADNTPTPLSALREQWPNCEIVHERGAPSSRKVPLLREVEWAAPGLLVEYFLDDTAPLATETRTSGSMVWMQMPGIGVPNRRGRVHVSGTLTPSVTGPHTFVIGSSAGFQLRVNREMVASQAEPPPIDDMGTLIRPDLISVTRELDSGVPVRVDIDVPFGPARAHSLHFGCRPPIPPDLLERAVAAARQSDAVVLVVGESQDSALESADRATTHLAAEQELLIQRVCAANPRTIVVLNAAHAVDMAWAQDAAVVLCVWFPGQEFGPALAAVLSGEIEPGGRLPVTFARDEADYPVFDLTPVDHDVVYETQPTIGYRHFAKNAIAPRYAFGYGLGYTTFSIADLEMSGHQIGVTVRNTGGRAGKEVVQVYVRAPDGAIALKAFSPVWLESGGAQRVALELDQRAFRQWVDGSGWQVVPGEYEILVGRASTDLPLRGIMTVA